jgi:methylamine dehydrogenase accessory protein MauD
MAATLLIARLLLAGVFLVAGVAKLADRAGSRKAMIDFGVPTALATPLAVLLPLAELGVAISLIPVATAWWGAVGALGLLLLFVVGITVNLARGRKPDCHCFGQLHSAPAGWKTLVRNGVLAAVAGFVVWEGRDSAGASAVSWLGALSITQLVGLVFGLVVLGLLIRTWWFLLELVQQNGRLLKRLETIEERLGIDGAAPLGLEGLPVGTQAPDFELSGLYGETLTLESLRAAGKPVMLLFTDPGCGPCNALMPDIGSWQQEHAEELTLALISRGEPEENRAKMTEHGLQHVLLQQDWEVSEAYKVNATPSAVVVLSEGTIGSPAAGGAENIGALVAQVAKDPTQLPVMHPTAVPAGRKIGEPAPEVKLADLEGETVDMEAFRGKKTLVLFWNPGCGFCQQILPDLKQWEANRPEGAPRLLVVSSGAEEINREQGFASTVVLDEQFAVGRAFGADGTPSAVLVDEEGKVASELAEGTTAVLDLTTRTRQGQA